jgi:hypothetical protein
MKTFLLVLVAILFIGRVNSQPKNLKPEPIADWKKIYDLRQKGESPDILMSGLLSENDEMVTVYLVDDERWYRLGVIFPRGCGERHEKTNHLMSFRQIKKFYRVPGPEAKIIAVGAGKPTYEKIEINYAR